MFTLPGLAEHPPINKFVDAIEIARARWDAELEIAERLGKKTQLLTAVAIAILGTVIFRLSQGLPEVATDTSAGMHSVVLVGVTLLGAMLGLTSLFDAARGRRAAVIVNLLALLVALSFLLGPGSTAAVVWLGLGVGYVFAAIVLACLALVYLLQPVTERPGVSADQRTPDIDPDSAQYGEESLPPAPLGRVRGVFQWLRLIRGSGGAPIVHPLPKHASAELQVPKDAAERLAAEAKRSPELEAPMLRFASLSSAAEVLSWQNYVRREHLRLAERALRLGVFTLPFAVAILLIASQIPEGSDPEPLPQDIGPQSSDSAPHTRNVDSEVAS